METKQYDVYINTNKTNKVFYVGVSSDLVGRIWQHKNKFYPNSFSARYNVDKLVYYETYEDVYEAIAREKQLKAGSRQKKIDLVEKENPDYEDLSMDWF